MAFLHGYSLMCHGNIEFQKGGDALWKLLNLTLSTMKEQGSEAVKLAKREEMKVRFKMDKKEEGAW